MYEKSQAHKVRSTESKETVFIRKDERIYPKTKKYLYWCSKN